MWAYTHQAARAQHQLSSLASVHTPFLACCRQCQSRPLYIAPNFHTERSSPQTAGNLNKSNYTILNTFKLNARKIWIFSARPDTLNPLRVVNWMLTKIQLNTSTGFPTSNTSKTSHTQGLNHRYLLYRGQKHTPALELRWAITLLSHGNVMLSVALRRTYKTIPTTHLQRLESTHISSVVSRRRAWRRTMTTFWRRETPLRVSQTSIRGIASKTSWLACEMISFSGSGNSTLVTI